MKKRKYSLFISIILMLGLSNACDVLEPEDQDIYDMNTIQTIVPFAEGILLNAYDNISRNHNNFIGSYASDDAVTNIASSNIKTVVTGGWTSRLNPFNVWNSAYESILYINTFLEEMGDVDWFFASDTISALFGQKLMGEAYGLRAWNYFNLLQAHAGKGVNGEMLGVPIVDRVLDVNNPDASEYQIPRSTFNELVEFILEDCDSAISKLPDRWINTGDGAFDQAMGEKNTNRINGLTVRLIKVKTILYAASPAFSDGTYTYQLAAEEAAALMDKNNGLTEVNFANAQNVEYYSNTNVTASGDQHPEVLWYSSSLSNSSAWEGSNYPPSLYGGGMTNPTQDLVNAFPMEDGTPTPDSKINSGDPYSGRDPRLGKFILYNGANLGRADIIINTTAGSQDALGSANVFATKTGYYLKKFMNVSDVNLDPTVNSGGLHYYTYARYTDVLLMFAEAANEAVGPDAAIGGYNAREVINAIRDRAGITSTAYVDGLSQAQMTDLIRNERRIEMCFEEQRFWDLRRWEMTTQMKQPVSGVEVSADGNTYNYLEVEDRNFADYQIYGPIPYTETLKYDLIQNEGWQ